MPCAHSGTSTIVRFSPRASSAARIASMPHSSPCAPAFGVIATAGMPVSSPASATARRSVRARPGRSTRLQRMDVGEARQPRHFLVEARIVLHRARAEREEAGVDGVVLARQAHVVAHRFRLGEAGQADRPCARARRGAGRTFAARRNRRRSLGLADLEDQRLLDAQRAIAGEGRRARSERLDRSVGRPCRFMPAPP